MMRLLQGKITRKPIRRTDHASIVRAVPEVLRDAVDLLLEIDGFGTLVKAASASLLGRGLTSVDIYSQRLDSGEDRPWIIWVLSAAMVKRDVSGQATPTGRLHPQATSAIEGGMT